MNHFDISGNFFNIDILSSKEFPETLQGSLETERKTFNIYSLLSSVNYEGGSGWYYNFHP